LNIFYFILDTFYVYILQLNIFYFILDTFYVYILEAT